MRASVPKTFVKPFAEDPVFCSERFRSRDGENPSLQAPAVLRARQLEASAKRRVALRRRLELALLEVQRGKPPHIGALEGDGDCGIKNRGRTIAVSKEAMHFGKQ